MPDVSVLGRQAPPAVASGVQSSEILNGLPSPATPQSAVPDEAAREYSRALAALYALRKCEQDASYLGRIEECVTFVESRLNALVDHYEPAGAPGPESVPPQGGPGAPQAAPPAQIPGSAQAAPPPGAPAAQAA